MDGIQNTKTKSKSIQNDSNGARWVPSRKACDELGVCSSTLRKWCDLGKIPVRFTSGGHRRYNINSWLDSQQAKGSTSAIIRRTQNKGQLANLVQNRTPTKDGTQTQTQTPPPEREGAIYCRVSSHKQKDDLERQISTLQAKFPNYKVFKDVASGLAFKKRKGLQRLLDQVQSGTIKEVVVAHRDRLARFSIEVIEWILRQAGATLVVLHDRVDPNPSPEQELAEDLMAVVTVFSCRFNGKRRYRNADQGGKAGKESAVQRAEAGPPKRKRVRTQSKSQTIESHSGREEKKATQTSRVEM
jgi:predicted site-specific integrase-resolvase